MRKYLLLDKNDITIIKGYVSRKELMKALGFNKDSQLKMWFVNNGVLNEKYVVVEDV